MSGRKSPLLVTLTDMERCEIERWLRHRNMRAGLVRRARAVLLVSDGQSLSETARMVGFTRKMVRLWVSRFVQRRVEGLRDKSGRGRKPVFPPAGTVKLAKPGCENPMELSNHRRGEVVCTRFPRTM